MRPLLLSGLLLLLSASGVASIHPQEGDAYPFDPLKAEQNLSVGEFHIRRGNYDAAIERLQEAIKYKPGFAKPMRLLGVAYEKKGFRAEAIEWYSKYVETLPGAPDAGKVRKRIEKLKKDQEREQARRRSK